MKMLIDPLIPINLEISANNESTKSIDLGVDFSYFTTDKAVIKTSDDGVTKTKRKYNKKEKVDENGIVIASAEVIANDTPYGMFDQIFNPTNKELEKAIAQTDVLSNEIKEDMDKIRSSNTIKNKYTYLTNLSSSAAKLIETKIQAIKELSNSRTQAIRLEMERQKITKEDPSKQNDDMRMMDMYNSFVNAPVGTYNPNPAPSLRELTSAAENGVSGNYIFREVNMDNDEPSVLSAQQIAMRASEDRNIKTVVRFNAETGARMFDVIDMNTGSSVPGVERPDNFLLQDTVIDTANGVAKNRNIGSSWELLVEGSAIEEY